MRRKHLLCILLFFIPFFNITKAQVSVKDSLALVDLYNSTDGSHWGRHGNWLTKNPVSTWYGVLVENQKVIQINLSNNKLNGFIPESIGNFDSLVSLNLSTNDLSDSIPSSIGNLKYLDNIYLADDKLNGSIPSSFGNMARLVTISMGQNKLSGELPSSLGNCSLLGNILLYNNELTGSIPSSFKNLTHLTNLQLTINKLSGELKDVFANQCPLQILNLGNNRYTGSIPDFLSRFTNLKGLYLFRNYFTGKIPEALGKLGLLQDLYLHQNKLSGPIPFELTGLSQLNFITLNDNSLSYNSNPQYSGPQNKQAVIYLHKNQFTFDGLEYLTKKYKSVYLNPQAGININLLGDKLSVSAGGTLSNNTYHWYKTGRSGSINMQGDSTFEPKESGQYYATVTNSVVVGLILKTYTVNYQMPLAKQEEKIVVSPNPTRNVTTIYGLDNSKNLKITIADMSGYIWLKTMSHQQSALKTDVSRLKAGNYLVTVNDGREVRTMQFVKE